MPSRTSKKVKVVVPKVEILDFRNPTWMLDPPPGPVNAQGLYMVDDGLYVMQIASGPNAGFKFLHVEPGYRRVLN